MDWSKVPGKNLQLGDTVELGDEPKGKHWGMIRGQEVHRRLLCQENIFLSLQEVGIFHPEK